MFDFNHQGGSLNAAIEANSVQSDQTASLEQSDLTENCLLYLYVSSQESLYFYGS